MKGNILEIFFNRKAGFIIGDNGLQYYFKTKDLTNCSVNHIEEGDQVEFAFREPEAGAKYSRAIQIRKTPVSEIRTELSKVMPGIHPDVRISDFNSDEQEIIKKLASTFFVTHAGTEVNVGAVNFKYCLVKPTDYYRAMFQLSREIVVVFSDFVEFEPRWLDAAAIVMKKLDSRIRPERGCQILIGNDSRLETKINNVLKDTNLNSIVIPFSYYELLHSSSPEQLIKDRFNKHLFEVDLFSETQPIKNEVFFFGRRDYAQDIATKCKIGSFSGVFGLRRSGKTSLLYAVKRLLVQEDYITIYIPCNSELSTLDWKTALHRVVDDIYKELGKKFDSNSNRYNCDNAANLFEDDMNNALGKLSKPVVMMFDEIEYITFGSKSSNSWQSGIEFINFWNAIRGYCLKYSGRVSIVIAGTNPMINEIPRIEIEGNLVSNPMYGQLAQSNQGAYLPPFDIESTKCMINTLGGYMGISFSDSICSKITCDCGGHPYLIRLLCKRINSYAKEQNKNRPFEVTEAIYEKVIPLFEKSADAQGFYSMILLILQESFPKEYNVLKILATKGDTDIVGTQDQYSLLHLLGYGLVDDNQGQYAIKFETVKRFLEGKYQFEVEGLSTKEQNQEISLRINDIETELRRIVRQNLKAKYGSKTAMSMVLSAMSSNNSAKGFLKTAQKLEYNQLFDPSLNGGCYLSVINDIIEKNYMDFSNLFENAVEKDVVMALKCLNKCRRAPAHSFDEESEKWTESEFMEFRKAASLIEGCLQEIK